MMPSIFALPLWENYVEKVLHIIDLSLVQLVNRQNLPDGEVELNRLFASLIRETRYQLRYDDINDCEYNSETGPLNDGAPQTYENKRPDMVWKLTNPYAQSPVDYVRHFAVECKRLGKPSSSQWKFNEQYYTNGILRYCKIEHSYGINADRGLMVGYVQTMNVNAILKEVNVHISSDSVNGLPIISLISQTHKTVVLHHQFVRVIRDSPFTLMHRWIDMT